MRSRLTGLVTLLVAVVLLVAIFIGTDRVERELVADVIDDAAVEQIFFYEGVGFDEFPLEHDPLDPDDGLFFEPETDEVLRSLLDLDGAGVLDGLLAAANTDRQTGVPVVLTSGRLVVVGLDGEVELLNVDLAEFESPLVSFFTVVDLAYQASGLDQFFDDETVDGGFFDDAPAFGDDSEVGEARVSYDTRDFQNITWVVGADVSDIDRSVDRIRSVMWISFPVVVAAAAVLTWLLTGRALRPVSRIAEQVGVITAGTLHERVPEPGTGDEIDGLAATMNGMLDRLEHDDRRLRQFVSDASHELRPPVALWVDDDGPGIEPVDRVRIFERFARLEQARTRDSGGAGLGLAVVAAVVSEASGSISVVESPLGGARFVIRLPASH